jgi:hypothetical protein
VRDLRRWVDTRTPVDDFAYQVPFRFTGAISKLTYRLGPEQLSAEEKATAAKILGQQKTRMLWETARTPSWLLLAGLAINPTGKCLVTP